MKADMVTEMPQESSRSFMIERLLRVADERQGSDSYSRLARYLTKLADCLIEDIERVYSKIIFSPRREEELAFARLRDIRAELRRWGRIRRLITETQFYRDELEHAVSIHVDFLREVEGKSSWELVDSLTIPGRKARKQEIEQESDSRSHPEFTD
jgi:hypothetical protein